LLNLPGIPVPACNNSTAVPCQLDLNGDCRFVPDSLAPDSDWGPFVCVLLTIPGCESCPDLAPSTCCSSGFAPGESGYASQNSQPSDSARRPSAFGDDCNQNGRPDECDLGFDPLVTDFNGNLIPDECEADADSLSCAAAACGQGVGTATVADGMINWWATYDWRNKPGWQTGFAIKMKFLELGFDLRLTMSAGASEQ